jgi:tetratricopeptide (TPR) repeat protein
MLVLAQSAHAHEPAVSACDAAAGGSDDAEAISLCTHVFDSDPSVDDVAEALNSRAVVYYRKGDLDAAAADVGRALVLASNYPEAYNTRGAVEAARDQSDAAIADFGKAIELMPDYAEAYKNRGLAYSRSSRLDEALRDIGRAVELEPSAELYLLRGITHGLKLDWDEAIQDYSAAIKLQPNTAQAYALRASAYLAKGNRDKAGLDCKHALALSSDAFNVRSACQSFSSD